MAEHARDRTDDNGAPVSVAMRVRVHPGTDSEGRGVVIEDFGEAAGHAVDVGSQHIADAARRFAVVLDTDSLVFVDSDDVVPE
jgi:hypothetical protein